MQKTGEVIQSAVIGAGLIAQQHLACVSKLPGVRLAGVCDLSRALAESAAERFGAGAWFTDHQRMLAEMQLDIVHITTPPASHFPLAQDCLNAGVHVFVEKPATARFEEFIALRTLAQAKRKWLIEDYNFLYSAAVRRLLDAAQKSALGEVVHVDVILCLDVAEKGNPFADPNLRHSALDLEGGVIADFLPHLASLAYSLCGPVRSVRTVWEKRAQRSPLPYDEFRGVLRGERATGALLFSAHSQPNLFRLTVFGSHARATADIYEDRFTCASMRPVPRALITFYNALEEAKVIRHSAWKLLWQKLGSGPGTYQGMWTLIRRVYEAVASGAPPPISLEDTFEVNRLVDELKKDANRL